MQYSQDSDVGSLVVSIIADKGFAGPPFSLENVPVHVYPTFMSDSIVVSLYDMTVVVKPDNRYYKSLIEACGSIDSIRKHE